MWQFEKRNETIMAKSFSENKTDAALGQFTKPDVKACT